MSAVSWGYIVPYFSVRSLQASILVLNVSSLSCEDEYEIYYRGGGSVWEETSLPPPLETSGPVLGTFETKMTAATVIPR